MLIKKAKSKCIDRFGRQKKEAKQQQGNKEKPRKK